MVRDSGSAFVEKVIILTTKLHGSSLLLDQEILKISGVTRKDIEVNRSPNSVDPSAFTVLPKGPFVINPWFDGLQVVGNPNRETVKITLEVSIIKVNVGINDRLDTIKFLHYRQPISYFFFNFIRGDTERF